MCFQNEYSTTARLAWAAARRRMESPLVNDYKKPFIIRRLVETFLGGIRLFASEDAPFYVYALQVRFPPPSPRICTTLHEFSSGKCVCLRKFNLPLSASEIVFLRRYSFILILWVEVAGSGSSCLYLYYFHVRKLISNDFPLHLNFLVLRMLTLSMALLDLYFLHSEIILEKRERLWKVLCANFRWFLYCIQYVELRTVGV